MTGTGPGGIKPEIHSGCSKSSRCEAPIQTGEPRNYGVVFIYAAVTSFEPTWQMDFFSSLLKEFAQEPGGIIDQRDNLGIVHPYGPHHAYGAEDLSAPAVRGSDKAQTVELLYRALGAELYVDAFGVEAPVEYL
ncbi:MAG: hypothetical protein Q8P48_11265, partial [Deltaproteobacteria bacterium]|nr:hypothetical protein [Deltaproteobacteria bacterium]